jgi:hypothetical protein
MPSTEQASDYNQGGGRRGRAQGRRPPSMKASKVWLDCHAMITGTGDLGTASIDRV